MIMLVPGIVGAMGLICMIHRRTFLGMIIGVQLLILGGTMMFVLSGIQSGARIQGHVVGLFVVFGGVAQLVAGYALAIRLFYLKSRIQMDELRSLKQ
jgi:NADH:ubiquinone oxidoreductase subunit K